MLALSGLMCKQAPSCSNQSRSWVCQELVTVAVNTKSRMVELGNLPGYFSLIQVTGEVQPPRLAGDYSSITAAVKQRSPGSCVEPQQGYCRKILQQDGSREKEILNALCIRYPMLANCCSRLLLQE